MPIERFSAHSSSVQCAHNFFVLFVSYAVRAVSNMR